MGIAISRTTDLSQNELLLKFVGKENVSRDDPFWNNLLTFNVKIPTTSNEQLALESQIEPLCQKLLSNNLRSGNLGSFLEVFLEKATLLVSTDIAEEDNLFCWQFLNGLFLLRCILKYLVETLTEEQLITHVEINKKDSTGLEPLIGILVEIIVDVPQNNSTYAIHLEAVTTLLIILSVQLHSSRKAEDSCIYKWVMRGKHAIHAPLLVKNLLQNFIDQKKPPPGLLSNNSHSIVLGIASELWSILTFNRKSEENTSAENTDFQEAPLATQSLFLLLVLVHHCTSQANPYRLSLFSCVNSQDNSPIPPTKEYTMFKIDYGQLYSTLCKKATKDAATLLLYLLLHRNSLFKTHLLNRLDIDQLVIPVLRTLYNAPNSNSHHIYMSLIILLIFSEDDTFNRAIHETKLKNIMWYTERNLSEVTLGGLLVLVVIRTIQYNMLKMRDKYLHTNCLAALANMSSQFRNLHPYVSQRLVSLFETLAKRYLRLKEKPAEVVVNLSEDNIDIKQDLAVLEEVLQVVLEMFNSCLSHQLINNPNLVYTMLYKRNIFEPFKEDPVFREVVDNIELIINYFSELLISKSQIYEVDAQQVLLTIQQGAKHWPKEKLKIFPELKFKYVEEEQPEEFFIPYVWELVCQESTLHWRTDNSVVAC